MRVRLPGRARGTAGVITTAAALGVLALSACTSSADDTLPDYRPSPPPTAVEPQPGIKITPLIPVPSLSGRGSASGPGGSSGPSGSGPRAIDPLVVAKRLTAPTGVVLLPDGTALVGERTTGRILRVQAQAGQPTPTVRTLSGLDTRGGGGLLDLAISPSYAEDSLVYAYITTRTDNRVVAFTLGGPVTPVVTGIPRGSSDNAGRLYFTGDGTLVVGTGDAGRSPGAGGTAGRLLRVTDIGQPAAGNPTASSPVWASGLTDLAGVCPTPSASLVLAVERGPAGRPGVVRAVRRGADVAAAPPLATLPAASGAPGDCTVQAGRVWVTSLDGKELLSAPLGSGAGGAVKIGAFTPVLQNRYGRMLTVVGAQDGALWITTSNKDGRGKPVADDERVIRYTPDATGGSPNPA